MRCLRYVSVTIVDLRLDDGHGPANGIRLSEGNITWIKRYRTDIS